MPRLTRLALVVAGNPDALGDPRADLRFEPTHSARPERHGLRERTVLDVQIDGAARKTGADLDVLAAQKRWRARALSRHGGHLVAFNGSTDGCIKSRPSLVPLELEPGTDSVGWGIVVRTRSRNTNRVDRAIPIRAYGSHLAYQTARRSSGRG